MTKKKSGSKKTVDTSCKNDCKKSCGKKKKANKKVVSKSIPVVPPPTPLPPISTQIKDKVFGLLGKIGWLKFND